MPYKVLTAGLNFGKAGRRGKRLSNQTVADETLPDSLPPRIVLSSLPPAARRAAWLAFMAYLPVGTAFALAFDARPDDTETPFWIGVVCLYGSYAMLYGALLVPQLTKGHSVHRVLAGINVALIIGALGAAAVVASTMTAVIVTPALSPFLRSFTGTTTSVGVVMLLTVSAAAAAFGAFASHALRAFARWPVRDPARTTLHRVHIISAMAAALIFAVFGLFILPGGPPSFNARNTMAVLAGALAGPLVHAALVSTVLPAEGRVRRPVRSGSVQVALVVLLAVPIVLGGAWISIAKNGDAVPRRITGLMQAWR